MARAPSQDQRLAKLETPFGKDVLSLVSLEARESISEVFDFDIEATSSEAALDFDKALGKNCCVTYKTHDNKERHFNGILTGAEWLGKRAGLHHYRLRLQPWFALLAYTSNCRFFQKMKVTDIIRKVFSDSGFSDFIFRTKEKYDEIEYCVQYRETNFAFVCRLMERYGIYYFFEHGKDKHEMVLADGQPCHQPLKDLARVPLRHLDQNLFREEQYLSGWKPTRRFETGKVSLNDYDYLKPGAKLLAESSKPGKYTRGDLEQYDYHADYTEQDAGEKFAKIRLESMQAFDGRREGSGDAPSLLPGGLVTLSEHDESAENKQYLVIACHHSIRAEAYTSSAGQAAPDSGYDGRYLFQPRDTPYRAPLRTPKPVISGLQTAKVVGKDGEEIDVDEHGRILVQFHWDRDKKQSRRVRVAQSWAGNAWGGIVIPRIGMEVVVEFVEGDPDYPLVTGTVYNGKNKPPFPLPEDKTISGMKSRSSKNDNGYNELIFEDKANSEKIRMHGEKDLDVTIKHAESWEIGCEFKPPRGKASSKKVVAKGDHELSVDTGNQKIFVGGSQSTDVVETISITAGICIKLQCGASTITLTPAGISITAPMITSTASAVISETAPMVNVTTTGPLNLTTASMLTATSGGAIAITAAGAITEVAGGAITHIAPVVI
ncbi:MAG: type VI secretion system Vgr family protein [Beijerinckiaceae bacterium]